MKQAHPQKSRIIPSRYKKAAEEILQNPATSSSSSLSNSGSSFEKSGARIKDASNLQRMSMGASAGSIIHINKMCLNKTPFIPQNKKCVIGLNPKLHSTALNNTTFLEKTSMATSEEFSTTVVGQKGFYPASIASLSELPDISRICPKLSNGNQGSETTAFSALAEREGEIFEEEDKDFTLEEINIEYLKYIIYALVNIRSKSAFEKQIKEGKKQMAFLIHLIEEEEHKLAKKNMKLHLLDHYNKISQNHELLKEKLSKLNEIAAPSTKPLTVLTQHLENRLNQVKLENISKPANDASYREDIQDLLQQNFHLLNIINDSMKPLTNLLHSLSILANNLTEEVDAVDECLCQGEKAASLTIQESSFRFTVNNFTKSA